MACQRNKSYDVSSLVGRSGEVVDALHRRKIPLCLVLLVDEASYFGKAVIRELLLLVFYCREMD